MRVLLKASLILIYVCSVYSQYGNYPSAATITSSTLTAQASTAKAAPVASTPSGFVPNLAAGNGSLTGDTVCNAYFCLSVTLHRDTSTAEFLLKTQGSFKPGWVGFGIGSSMLTSDIIVAWPNADRSTTISRRKAHGYVMPEALSDQSALTKFPVAADAAGNDGSFTVHLSRPLSLAESTLSPVLTNFIWAVSTSSPSDSNPSATFTEHTAKNTFTFDLSRTINNGLFAPPSSSSASSSYDTFVYAHGALMFLAWGVSMPTAIIIASFFRSLHNWVRIHWSIQVFGTGLFFIAGYILGRTLHGDRPDNIHTQLANPIAISLLVQIFLGWIIHHLYDPNRTRRPIRNWAHRSFGFILLLVGFVQMPLGLLAYTSSKLPLFIYGGYLVVLVIVFIGLGIWSARMARRGRYGQLNNETNRLAILQGDDRIWTTEGDDDEFGRSGREKL